MTRLGKYKSISVGDFEKTRSTRFKVKRMHYWKKIKLSIKNFLIEEENYMFYYRQRPYLYRTVGFGWEGIGLVGQIPVSVTFLQYMSNVDEE